MSEIDFAFKVAAFVEKAKANADKAFRGVATEAIGRVKELTPVKTGFLRANFVDVLKVDAIPKPSADQSVGQAIDQARIGDTIFIVNPVPYARRVEYGFVGTDKLGRSYNQPGRGMVQQTVAELPQIAERVVRRFT